MTSQNEIMVHIYTSLQKGHKRLNITLLFMEGTYIYTVNILMMILENLNSDGQHLYQDKGCFRALNQILRFYLIFF